MKYKDMNIRYWSNKHNYHLLHTCEINVTVIYKAQILCKLTSLQMKNFKTFMHFVSDNIN